VKLSDIPVPSAATRQKIYIVATAALALLVAYGLIEPDKVPLWASLVGSILGILGTGTATAAVTAQRKSGMFINESTIGEDEPQ
jgi:hypothetical protein